MSIEIKEDGTIALYQGDTGEIVVNGINEQSNFRVYFAIQDLKRNAIGKEIVVNANKTGMVSIKLPSDLTDLLEVPNNKTFQIYNYGIKCCEVGSENKDTLFIGDGEYGTINQICVYPRKVGGDRK